jgi:hypothetical protein
MMHLPHRLTLCLALAGLASVPAVHADAAPVVDVLRFGDAGSESAHKLQAQLSERFVGALQQPARKFLPRGGDDWRGGEVSFELGVKPAGRNYLSVKLWGEDVSGDQATLYCDGKQLGHRQLSDHDILDQGTKYPVAPGRFHYLTHSLPLALTQGKEKISCRLRITGPVWRYGGDFAKFQRPMAEASRGFYALLIHTDKMVPLDQVEGAAPARPVKTADGSAVLASVKQRVDKAVTDLWRATRAPSQLEISLLAKTFDQPWSRGYKSDKSLARVVAGIDDKWAAYQRDPQAVYNDATTPNADWFGMGLVGEALRVLAGPLGAELDVTIPNAKGGSVTRRQALEEMFVYSRDWNKRFRRMYTNQSMIKDLFGIWYGNEGLIAIGSVKADPREKLLPLLHESMGLLPWSGSLDAQGKSTWQAGEGDARFMVPRNYFQTTSNGLTRELGFVGGYGEVLDWAASIYEATRPAKGQPGDAKIRDQLVKIAKARAIFRYPHWDGHGDRTMRLEAAIGWRDIYWPGDAIYAQRPSWDASPLQVAVATEDPALLGYAQQMFDDNQFYEAVEHMLETKTLRATIGLVDVVGELGAFHKLPRQLNKLPMTPDAPDFVFADTEDGVVAIKNAGEVLYASLYWRANYGINGFGRVHYVTDKTDRVATVPLDRQDFVPSGLFHDRPNNPHINGRRFSIRYPDDGDVWDAGEKQPVAQLPDGVKYLAGEDNSFAGRADLYVLSYGPYFIAMNGSKSKAFTVDLPKRVGPVRELVAGQVLEQRVSTLKLEPGRTVVLHLGDSGTTH